jgi:hypothetical protein
MMDKSTIISLILDALELETIDGSMMLDRIPEYDSMGILMIMEMFEQNGIDLFPEDFISLTIVSDLVSIIHSKQ